MIFNIDVIEFNMKILIYVFLWTSLLWQVNNRTWSL